MPRRIRYRGAPREQRRNFFNSFPWKLLLLLPIIVVLAIPAYTYGARIGNTILPSVTHAFYTLSGPPPPPTPTPFPAFPAQLPHVGTRLYTAQEGDSCDEILDVQMNMTHAGQVFSDIKPETVKALDAAVGQNCQDLQPGVVLSLSAHYPLVALGGIIVNIEATSPQQVLPTPLISIPNQPQPGVDCSNGCLLVVRIAPDVQVKLTVQTTILLHTGAWVWAQAMLARKVVPGFDDYPYADPAASLNGMSLRACDFQVNDVHDSNSLSCDQLTPNTIDDDGGAWLFGVTGPGSLDHWHYAFKFAPGTCVLLWLTLSNGNLIFKRGNPLYRFDETKQAYVPA